MILKMDKEDKKMVISSRERRNEIYQKAIDIWGIDAQIEMIIEEASELIHVLQKLKRGRTNHDDVKQEIADNQIMQEQAELIFGNCDSEFFAKFDRLENRVKSAELKKLGVRK